MLIFAFNDDNIGRRNFARAFLIGEIIAIAFVVVILIFVVALGVIGSAAV